MSDSSESFSFTEWEAAFDVPSDLLADDGRGIHELKISNKLYKTKEEVDKFCVDESLSELDRALFIVKNGMPVQKLSVLNNFSNLMAEFPRRAIEEVLPAIVASVTSCASHAEYQNASCHFLADIVGHVPASSGATLQIFELAKTMMKTDKEALVQSWSKAFLTCIERGLPRDLLIQHAKAAIAEGGFTQPVQCRIWCAKVLGSASMHLNSSEIQDVLLDKALSLCQDTDMDVRACMARHLNKINRNVTPAVSHGRVMPEFVELIMDEELPVREAALEGIGLALPTLDSDSKKDYVVPTWLSIIGAPNLAKVLSRECGRFLWYCKAHITDSDLQIFIKSFCEMASSSDVEVRSNCAYNMPGIIKALGPDPRVLPSLEKLSADPQPTVKQKLAHCLSVIAELLGSTSYLSLKGPFFTLFSDQESGCPILLEALERIAICFTRDEAFRRGTEMNDFLYIVFRKARELIGKSKWRHIHDLLYQVRNFGDTFDPEQLYDVGIPVLMRVIFEAGRVPQRELAARILVLYVRRFRRLEHRDSVCRSLISDLAFSADYRLRMLFVVICKEALESCSFRFFRQYFAHAYLAMATDAVVGVRRKMLTIMPQAAVAILSVPDDALLKKFNASVDVLRESGHPLVLRSASEEELIQDKEREGDEDSILHDEAEDTRRIKEVEIRRIAVTMETSKERRKSLSLKTSKSLHKDPPTKLSKACGTSSPSSCLGSPSHLSMVSATHPDKASPPMIHSPSSSISSDSKGLSVPIPTRRARLRSAGTSGGPKELDCSDAARTKSISNSTLNYLSAGSLSNGSSSGSLNAAPNKHHTPTTSQHDMRRRLSASEASHAMNAALLERKREKAGSGSVKLPALAKNMLGR